VAEGVPGVTLSRVATTSSGRALCAPLPGRQGQCPAPWQERFEAAAAGDGDRRCPHRPVAEREVVWRLAFDCPAAPGARGG
jgi:hypothetical protein